VKKIILITEYLDPPYDEGIKKTVYNLFLNLNENYKLEVICRYGIKKDNIHVIDTNPLFFSKKIKTIIENFKPNVIIYLPFQSSTFASYLRLKVFSFFANRIKIIFIALQPKPLKKWQQFITKFIKPEIALTPSPALKQSWDKLKIKNKLIPLLTDLNVFKPISNQISKKTLREKYNLPIDAFIISHMGHLNDGRNLKTLIPLQNNGLQVVIVGSSSTPKDAHGQLSLKEELEKTGIIILNKFIENIEEIYHLSDVYIFPVVAKNSSIGLPLSILEARACDIPVITTDYGSVKYYLGTDNDGIFFSKPNEFYNKVKEIKNRQQNHNKSLINLLNDKFYDIILNSINP